MALTDTLVEILLVEDNPADVKLALHALNKNHLANHVEVVRDGAAALDFIFCIGPNAHRRIDNGPRLVLLDLKLPKVDGLEVLQRVKADERTRKIPVVVLTSSREERDIVESYSLGVNSYIVKPVDFEQFTEAVHKLGFYWLRLSVSSRAQTIICLKIAWCAWDKLLPPRWRLSGCVMKPVRLKLHCAKANSASAGWLKMPPISSSAIGSFPHHYASTSVRPQRQLLATPPKNTMLTPAWPLAAFYKRIRLPL